MTPLRVAGAALAAGLLLGVGGRVVMRLLATLAGHPGAWSRGGTLDVIAFGALLGTPLALAFLFLRSRVRVSGPWPGPLLGAVAVLGFALLPPESARSAMAGTPVGTGTVLALFGGLLVSWGALLEWLWRRTRRPVMPG